jgi:hypothetical protein
MCRAIINAYCDNHFFFLHGATNPSGPGPLHYGGFTIALRHTTLGRTPPDEWSARPRDLYLTQHDIHKSKTSMPPAGFEPAITGYVRPQTHNLDRAATGISSENRIGSINKMCAENTKSSWARSQNCEKRLLTTSCLSVVCPCVRPSFRMEQFGSQWTDFHEI